MAEPFFRLILLSAGCGAGLLILAQDTPPEVHLAADFGKVLHTMRGGFGASWHAIEQPIPVVGDRSHGGSAWGAHPPAEDEQAWRQLYQHQKIAGRIRRHPAGHESDGL